MKILTFVLAILFCSASTAGTLSINIENHSKQTLRAQCVLFKHHASAKLKCNKKTIKPKQSLIVKLTANPSLLQPDSIISAVVRLRVPYTFSQYSLFFDNPDQPALVAIAPHAAGLTADPSEFDNWDIAEDRQESVVLN